MKHYNRSALVPSRIWAGNGIFGPTRPLFGQTFIVHTRYNPISPIVSCQIKHE